MLGRSLINSVHSLALPCFTYLTAKEYYRSLEFLNYTLGHMKPEVLNIGTFDMFKSRF